MFCKILFFTTMGSVYLAILSPNIANITLYGDAMKTGVMRTAEGKHAGVGGEGGGRARESENESERREREREEREERVRD